MSPIFVAALAFLAGALLTWLAYRANSAAALATARTECADARRRVDELAAQLSERQRALEEIGRAHAALGAEHPAAMAGFEERQRNVYQRAVDEIVAPIRETLEKVTSRVNEADVARASSHAELQTLLQSIGESNRALASETQRLASTMNASSTRGRWGELQLRRICEMAGMLDHCDFIEQQQSQGEGGSLRPDLKVMVPGGKVIIVDAKVPFAAFDAAIAATDEATRAAKLRDHAAAVRGHMRALSARAYGSQIAEAMEFVVMFMPGEMLFSAALQQDPELLTFSIEHGVIPASPTTLISLLRAISYGWRQDALATNAAEISALGAELYDRIRAFASHHAALRKHLDNAVQAYNQSVGSLETRVLASARKFESLGVATRGPLGGIATIERQTRDLVSIPDVVATPEPTGIPAEIATLPAQSTGATIAS